MHRTKGFTLVETVIYVALVSAISVSIVTTLLLLTKSWSTIKISKNINTAAVTTFERMTREIRNAESVDQAASTLDSTPGTLKINTASSTITFSLASNTLWIQQGTGSLARLTPSTVTPTNLRFRRISTSQSEAVRIEMELQSSALGKTITQSFYTTVILRGTYSN